MTQLGRQIDELSVEQLYAHLQLPNDLLLLDVRNDQEFSNWRIEGPYSPETVHVHYVNFVEAEEEAIRQVPEGREIVVVCAKGGASDYVAEILRSRGNVAVNLSGGMIAWGNHMVIRPMIEREQYAIYQLDRPARGCLSYILASQGQAAIIDPLRLTEPYQQFLVNQGLELALLLDTHAHADHLSGGPALAQASGAPYYLHPYDGIHPFDMLPARLPFKMLDDGMQFQLGSLDLKVLHVPGHTLGLVNFLASAGDGESYLFTGDSLFIQSFGRPDLGGQGQAWAPLVYDSLFGRLRQAAPPEAWVLPGHYARSDEAHLGGEMAGIFTQRLGHLWASNRDLQVANREEFVQYVLGHLPTLPPQYIQIKRANIGLVQPDEQEASELELGKNICALSTAY